SRRDRALTTSWHSGAYGLCAPISRHENPPRSAHESLPECCVFQFLSPVQDHVKRRDERIGQTIGSISRVSRSTERAFPVSDQPPFPSTALIGRRRLRFWVGWRKISRKNDCRESEAAQLCPPTLCTFL